MGAAAELVALSAAGAACVRARAAVKADGAAPGASQAGACLADAALALWLAAAAAAARAAVASARSARARDGFADGPPQTARVDAAALRNSGDAVRTATRVGTRLRLHRRASRVEAAAVRAELERMALRQEAVEDALRRLADEAKAAQQTMESISDTQRRVLHLVVAQTTDDSGLGDATRKSSSTARPTSDETGE